MEGHFVARNGKGESSKMSGGHVPAESLPWGKEAQPAPIARTLERKPSQKFRRAAWKIGRTHSAKPKFDISKVIRAWKVKNEVPRWMQQTQEDAKAMFAAAKPREKAEALRNFAVQQQSKLPLWEFLVKLSAQTEDLEPEEDLFESHWEEVENILDIKKKDVAGAAATEIQAHTDFGPMGDLPIHTCFLLCYSGRTEKLRSVMKRIAKEVVQHCYMTGEWPTINEPYENDFHLWQRLGSEIPHFKITEDSGGDEFGMYTGETILHIAIANQDRDLVEWMLDHGASLDVEATGSFFLPKVIKVIEDDMKLAKEKGGSSDPVKEKSGASDRNRRLSTESRESAEGDPAPASSEHGEKTPKYVSRLSYRAWVYRALVAWLRGMDLNEARVTLRRNMASAYASIASDTLEKDSADDDTLAQDEAALGSITKSMLYFGGMPLSFAVTVGDLPICKLLMERADPSEYSAILNKTDHYGGNTALHMAALHGRTEILDWLVEEGKKSGKNSLSIMNKDGHTALTLAARMGNVELFKHILEQHFRTMIWIFGDMALSQTSLEQVDTFKIQKQKKKDDEEEQVEPQPGPRRDSSMGNWFALQARRLSRGSSFIHRHHKHHPKQRRLPAVDREVWELHKERKFRSALQVIVDHEIEAFCEEEVFNALLMEKWEKFGFRLYVLRTLVPYFLFLIFFTANVITRCDEIRHRWADSIETGFESSASVEHSTYSRFLSGMVAFFGALFFVDGWSHRRLRPEDLNPEQDGDMTTSKVMRAVYRNMSFGLSLAISAVVIAAFAFQMVEQDYLELNMLAISCIFVFCYLLHTLVPFKTFGVLVIMIYRIFVKDVLYFLIIYAFLLCAFGIGIWMMYQKAQYPEELEYGRIRMDEYVGASLLSSVWVSLHEVDTADYIMASQFPGLSMSFHLVWILFSTVLMLNLLIGLMRQTFDSDKTKSASHRLWIFPFASLVLRHEKMLSTWWARRLLRFRHPARYRSGLMVNNHIDFIDDDDEIACQRFYHVNMGKPPSSAATSTSTPSATKPQDAAADPAKDHAKPAEPVDADTANNSLHTQPEPEHLDIPEPKSESEPAASRRTMLPPPSASETQALVHGHRSQARRPSPRTPTPPLALPVSAEPLDVVAMGGVSGRKGALDAKERVKAIQRRLAAVQQRVQGVGAVKERHPLLVRTIAQRISQCGAAIACELAPIAAAVAECRSKMEDVELECQAVAEAVEELDPEHRAPSESATSQRSPAVPRALSSPPPAQY